METVQPCSEKENCFIQLVCDKAVLFFHVTGNSDGKCQPEGRKERSMRWALNLYTTEKTKKKLPRIMQRLRKGIPQPGIWIVAIASNQENLLDIFHSPHYLQPMFSRLNPDIVGIAESEDAAKELVVRMLEEIYRETGTFNVRTYFKFQE